MISSEDEFIRGMGHWCCEKHLAFFLSDANLWPNFGLAVEAGEVRVAS
jgi:hypothetical protein